MTPWFFSTAPSDSGRYPNRCSEIVSIGIHIGPVRRPQGWNLCAKGSESHLQITSFRRGEGRISHSSHSSGPDPANWVGDRRCGAGLMGVVKVVSLYQHGTCCCFQALPLVSHFLVYVSYFFFEEVSRAVSRRLFTVFDKRVIIIMHTVADLNAVFLFWICMMNGGSGREGQSTSSNGTLRNIIDHSVPRINNKQGKSAVVTHWLILVDLLSVNAKANQVFFYGLTNSFFL